MSPHEWTESQEHLYSILQSLISPNIRQYALVNYSHRKFVELSHNSVEQWQEDWLTKLTRLKVSLYEVPFFDLLCVKLSSLVYLDVQIYHDQKLNISQLLISLLWLKRLKQLKLSISYRFSEVTDLFANNTLDLLPRLESLRWVQLQFLLDPHKLALIDSIFVNADLEFQISRIYFCSYGTLMCKEHTCVNCKYIQSAIVECRKQDIDIDLVHFHCRGGVIQSHRVRKLSLT